MRNVQRKTHDEKKQNAVEKEEEEKTARTRIIIIKE